MSRELKGVLFLIPFIILIGVLVYAVPEILLILLMVPLLTYCTARGMYFLLGED